MHPLRFEEPGALHNLEAWSQMYPDKIRPNPRLPLRDVDLLY